MGFRRWLVVGVCVCLFCGCKSAQSYYDYCGPMPTEGGDFMYRKNSVLGGDPAMTRINDEAPDQQGEDAKESGPEPTPAPPPDQEPAPGMDMNGDRPTLDSDGASNEMDDEDLEVADDGSDSDLDELGESEDDVDDEVAAGERRQAPGSTVEWHAPVKNGRSAVRQVRFQAD